MGQSSWKIQRPCDLTWFVSVTSNLIAFETNAILESNESGGQNQPNASFQGSREACMRSSAALACSEASETVGPLLSAAFR